MRYDTPVTFRQLQRGVYDSSTGNYSPDTVALSETRNAAVMDSSVETMKLVYGEIKQGSKTIHLQNRVVGPYNCVVIGSDKYRIDHEQLLRTKQILVVSEVL